MPLDRRLLAQRRQESVDLARQRPVIGHGRCEVDDQLFLGLGRACPGAGLQTSALPDIEVMTVLSGAAAAMVRIGHGPGDTVF